MQETGVRLLGWEDSLEKEMAAYSSILAWRIPLTEEPGRLQSMELQELDMTWWLNHHHEVGICSVGNIVSNIVVTLYGDQW